MTEPMCFIIHPHVPETEQGGRNRLGKSCCMLLNKESIQKAHKGLQQMTNPSGREQAAADM